MFSHACWSQIQEYCDQYVQKIMRKRRDARARERRVERLERRAHETLALETGGAGGREADASPQRRSWSRAPSRLLHPARAAPSLAACPTRPLTGSTSSRWYARLARPTSHADGSGTTSAHLSGSR